MSRGGSRASDQGGEVSDGTSDVDAVVSDVLNDETFQWPTGWWRIASTWRLLCFVPVFFHAYAQVRTKREEWGSR